MSGGETAKPVADESPFNGPTILPSFLRRWAMPDFIAEDFLQKKARLWLGQEDGEINPTTSSQRNCTTGKIKCEMRQLVGIYVISWVLFSSLSLHLLSEESDAGAEITI